MDLSLIEAAFLTAMQAGYAIEGVSNTKVLDLPGYKEIRYEDGDFLIVDRWCVNAGSRKSAGTTTIWHKGVPVWFMSYGGYYPTDKAIFFLKHALRHQYCKDRHFNGGRGPTIFAHTYGNMVYRNRPEVNEFRQFRGREEIISIREGWIGYHDYWGMSLL